MSRPVAMAIAMIIAAFPVATADAHVGFALRQRIDIGRAGATVLIWGDYTHAKHVQRGKLQAALSRANDATRVEASRGDCQLVRSAAREMGEWMFELSMTFECPSGPSRMVLHAADALGAGPMQHVELRRGDEVHGYLRGSTPTLDVPEADANWRSIGRTALLALIFSVAAFGLLASIGSMTRRRGSRS